ncbi:MAG: SHOCT domain-containing protein [Tepidisphaeraceae bacterium]|jgi:uncharacterized membrane protein
MAVLPGILADEDPFAVVFACLFLLIIVLAGAYVVMWLRRRFWGPDDGEVPNLGFTLGDLRELNRSGQISDEEFKRAKEKILAMHQQALQRDAAAAKPNVNKPPPQGP